MCKLIRVCTVGFFFFVFFFFFFSKTALYHISLVIGLGFYNLKNLDLIMIFGILLEGKTSYYSRVSQG